MSAGLKGNVGTIRAVERNLRRLPLVIAAQVATRVAGEITKLARQTFNSGQNAYGDRWKPDADGKPATLRKTGLLASGIAYVGIGTKLRAQLGPDYSKYAVGPRPVFPRGKLPLAYNAAIARVTNDVATAEIARG